MELVFSGKNFDDILKQLREAVVRLDAEANFGAGMKFEQSLNDPAAVVAEGDVPVHRGMKRAPAAPKPEKTHNRRTTSKEKAQEQYDQSVADSHEAEAAGQDAPDVPAREQTTGAMLEHADQLPKTSADAYATFEHLYNAVGGNDEAAEIGLKVLALFNSQRFRDLKAEVDQLSEDEQAAKWEIFIDECNKELAAYKKARK